MKIHFKKSIVVAIGLFLIWTIAFLLFYQTAIGLGLMSHLKGYVDYCAAVKLPYTLDIILSEIVLTTILCSLYIYAEFFKLTKKFLKCILILAVLNLGFIAYQVVQYPLLLHVSLGWGNNSDHVEAISHPLLYVSFCFAFLIILLTYRKRRIIAHQSLIRLIYIISILMMITEIVSILNVEYKKCIG